MDQEWECQWVLMALEATPCTIWANMLRIPEDQEILELCLHTWDTLSALMMTSTFAQIVAAKTIAEDT